MTILEKVAKYTGSFGKISPLIKQEIENQNSSVINSILCTNGVESQQQLQPLLTAIDRVMPSITNDLNDSTLTPGEKNAGGKKNYLIKTILESRSSYHSYLGKIFSSNRTRN